MIKILKQGNIGQVECGNCKALLQYQDTDVRHMGFTIQGEDFVTNMLFATLLFALNARKELI